MRGKFEYFEIAARCNEDIRFKDAQWQESSESLEALTRLEDFRSLFNTLSVSGRATNSAEVFVATVYAYRSREKRVRASVSAPKHGSMKLS